MKAQSYTKVLSLASGELWTLDWPLLALTQSTLAYQLTALPSWKEHRWASLLQALQALLLLPVQGRPDPQPSALRPCQPHHPRLVVRAP